MGNERKESSSIRGAVLDEQTLKVLLRDAGLAFERWLKRPGWVRGGSGGERGQRSRELIPE